MKQGRPGCWGATPAASTPLGLAGHQLAECNRYGIDLVFVLVPERSGHLIYSETILIKIKERPTVSLSTVNVRPLNGTDTSHLGGSLSCVRAHVSPSFSLSGGT